MAAPSPPDGHGSSSSNSSGKEERVRNRAWLAGGLAGTSVDVALFPLDTLKTRLQARAGFRASGGLSGVYAGLGPVLLTSAPSAALFFTTYEGLCALGSASREQQQQQTREPLLHMGAACVAEAVACTIRVPGEVIKQRLQARHHATLLEGLGTILRQEGMGGLYQGFAITLFRELPFACIQYPLYEALKQSWRLSQTRRTWLLRDRNPSTAPLHPWEAALAGSLAGAVAAGCTTPCDVVKTRIMLHSRAREGPLLGIPATVRRIWRTEGPRAFWRGIVPRVTWISLGGGIFFGVYEVSSAWLRES